MQDFVRRLIHTARSSRTIQAISKVYAGDILSKLISVTYAVLLIRGLSQEDYASYVAFRSVIMLVHGLIGVSINTVLVRYSAEQLSITNERPVFLYTAVLKYQLLLYLVLTIVCMPFLSEIAVLLFGGSSFTIAVFIGLLSTLGMLLIDAVRSYFQAEERFNLYIATLWIRQVATLVFVAFAWLFDGMIFLVIAVGLGVVDTLTGLVLLFRSVGLEGLRQRLTNEQRAVVKDFLVSTVWLLGFYAIQAFMRRIDVFMLSRYQPETELAVYGVAYQYFSLAVMALSSIGAVLRPKFARVEMQHDSEAQLQFIKKWIIYTVWIIIPIALADLVGRPIFILVNGSQYEQAYDVFTVLSVGVWLGLVLSPLVQILIARKAFMELFFIACLAIVVCAGTNYVAVQHWGALGTAVATVLTHATLNGTALIVTLRKLWRARKEHRQTECPDVSKNSNSETLRGA